MTDQTTPFDARLDEEGTRNATVRDKLIDAMTPGFWVEFDPAEAEHAGAFIEEALGEEDAIDSVAGRVLPDTGEG